MTVEQIVRDYLAYKTGQMMCGLLSRAACIKTHYYLESFARDFGQQEVEQCRRSDLKRFLGLHPEYKSPHTKSDAAGQVVTCFRWAEEEGLCTCPYRRPRDLPALQPRQPIRPDEVRAILHHARNGGRGTSPVRFRMALWFLWETGCRTCELFNLDWSHYDAERGLFEMPSKTTAKTGRKRLIVLTARAWRLIRLMARAHTIENPAPIMQSVRAAVTNNSPVFLNGRNRRWTRKTFGHMFRKYADRAGVRKEVSAYCLRHGFCCERLEAGAGERQLADYMGHSTTRYISWYGRGVREKIDYLRSVAEQRKPT